MYNYFLLIGIITSDVEVTELSDGKKVVNINLAVARDFKNANGEYDYDNIRVSIWDFLADVAVDNLKKGCKVGLKGRISPKSEVLDGGIKTRVNNLFADRIIFFEQQQTDIIRNEIGE